MRNALRFGVGLMLCAAHSLEAQQVRAILFDSAQVAPVSGGFLLLMDAEGQEVDRMLANADGFVVLQAPDAGRFRLRYERVGFASVDFDSFGIESGGTRDHALTFAVRPRSTLTVRTGSVCGDPAGGPADLADLWREIEAGLSAVAWLGRRDAYLHRTLGFDRTLDSALGVIEERTARQSGMYRPPLTTVAAQQLADDGYIGVRDGDTFYFAPDANVLRDASFLEHHCFTIEPGVRGRVGLAFAPRGEGNADVRGVIWVDRASGRLVSLEYSYVNDPSGTDDEQVGGTVDFAELPTGAWVVRRWQIRLPGVELVDPDDESAGFVLTGGYQERGADILELVDPAGSTIYTPGFATLAGAVFDSTRNVPLGGAEVVLDGTPFTTTTDALGRFTLNGPFAGTYGVTYYHPHLDSLAFHPFPQEIVLRPGETTVVSLATAPLEPLLHSVCPNLVGLPIVTGIVYDLDGVPVAGADLVVSSPSVPAGLMQFRQFEEVQGVISTDDRGSYTICGPVPRARISLRAERGDRNSGFVTLMFVQGGVMRAEVFHPMNHIVWRQDFTLYPPDRLTATLSGVVMDSAGGILAGANVRLIGTDHETRTNAAGRFALDGLPGGWTRLEVRSVGHRALERDVELRLDEALDLAPPVLTLEAIPIRLQDLVVEADAPTDRRRQLADFDERRRSGQGDYVTRDEFMSRGNPFVPSDILRTMRGLRIQTEGLRVIITSSRGSATFDGACSPALYLDNMYLGDTGSTDVDAVLNVEHIEAMEVYSSSTVPMRFNRGCGAIVVWTR